MNEEEEEEEEEEEGSSSDELVDPGQGSGSGAPRTEAALLRGASGMAGGSSGENSSSGLPLRSNGTATLIRSVDAASGIINYNSLGGAVESEREQGAGGGGSVGSGNNNNNNNNNNSLNGPVGSEREQGGSVDPEAGANHVPGGGGGSGGVGDAAQQVQYFARCRLLRLVVSHVLDRLTDVDQFGLFQEPVKGVRGYKDVIKFPMDFATIRRKLLWNCYASIRDVAQEVRLICSNAMAFNASEDLEHKQAKCATVTYDAL